jgi:hypothetical protein
VIAIRSAELTCESLLAEAVQGARQRHVGAHWSGYARYRLIAIADLLAKLLKCDYCQWAASGLLVRSFAVVSPVVLAVYHDDTGWSEDCF